MSREAYITINGVALSEAQAIAVRVAVSDFLSELQDPEHREALGAIADGYEARLTEIENLLMRDH